MIVEKKFEVEKEIELTPDNLQKLNDALTTANTAVETLTAEKENLQTRLNNTPAAAEAVIVAAADNLPSGGGGGNKNEFESPVDKELAEIKAKQEELPDYNK